MKSEIKTKLQAGGPAARKPVKGMRTAGGRIAKTWSMFRTFEFCGTLCGLKSVLDFGRNEQFVLAEIGGGRCELARVPLLGAVADMDLKLGARVKIVVMIQ